MIHVSHTKLCHLFHNFPFASLSVKMSKIKFLWSDVWIRLIKSSYSDYTSATPIKILQFNNIFSSVGAAPRAISIVGETSNVVFMNRNLCVVLQWWFFFSKAQMLLNIDMMYSTRKYLLCVKYTSCFGYVNLPV